MQRARQVAVIRFVEQQAHDTSMRRAFEVTFNVPTAHRLRLVRTLRRAEDGEICEWEHEEYDASGKLVAVFESWPSGHSSPAGRQGGRRGRGGFVKYAPNGEILRRSEDAPLPPLHDEVARLPLQPAA
jgi:hypothetical protein